MKKKTKAELEQKLRGLQGAHADQGQEVVNLRGWVMTLSMILVLVLALAITLGVTLGPKNACPEPKPKSVQTLEKSYIIGEEECWRGGYGINENGDWYSYTNCEEGLENLWGDIERLTKFTNDDNPLEITDVTIHYRYNTPQETDYIEGEWNHELGSKTMRLEDARIYPNPPVWTYGNVTIYPEGKEVSQTYVEPEPKEDTIYYFRSNSSTLSTGITISGS